MAPILTVIPGVGSTLRRSRSASSGCRSSGTLLHSSSSSHRRAVPNARTTPRSARPSGPKTTWCRSVPVRRNRLSAVADRRWPSVTFACGDTASSAPLEDSVEPPSVTSCSTSPTTCTTVADSASASSAGSSRSLPNSRSMATTRSSSWIASRVSTSRWVPRTAGLSELSA
ncbi:hypothetical protein [Amycolatopsis anabasis]|uniref:hypothetical protein n=1 Tax=Amycolatopsis anabasis TaxID=1840409 RepID=UPI001FE8DBDD|nr:hypothetical protein [Amycolatopsis anabasis]